MRSSFRISIAWWKRRSDSKAKLCRRRTGRVAMRSAQAERGPHDEAALVGEELDRHDAQGGNGSANVVGVLCVLGDEAAGAAIVELDEDEGRGCGRGVEELGSGGGAVAAEADGDRGVVRGDVAADLERGRESVDLAIGLEVEPGLARGILQERCSAVELEGAEALDGAGVDLLVGGKLEAGEREEAAARAAEERWQGLACDRGDLLGTRDEILFAAALAELAQRSGRARQDGAAV